VRTLVRQQDRGAELLAKLGAMPVAQAIDALSLTLARENDKRLDQLQVYQRALAIYSTVLLALLAYAGWKLFRNNQMLNRANEDLQRANRELKESQVHLVQSEKRSALGQMVAGIAHEINTPLAYIKSTFSVLRDQLDPLGTLATQSLGFAQAMRAPIRDHGVLNRHFQQLEAVASDVVRHGVIDEIDGLLEDGTHGIDQISEIVLNLKNFSRLDREKIADFSVEAGLDSTLLLARNVLKNGVQIRKDYGRVPDVSGSPSQINQVFLNIITNAVQAMPARAEPSVITLRTSVSDEGDMVQVEIQDNGSGIPQDVVPHIFDPFYTTKPIGQGTGMGLSISYKIIQAHGGRILVDTAQGVGTVFTILLPLQRAAQDAGAADASTAQEPAEALFAD
jgi:signal transduction histidine kinase